MLTDKISNEILDIIPKAMRTIRSDMRGHALPELSVAQFRILSRLDRGSQSNKELAEWVGVSTAAMSRTIDNLAEINLVQRVQHEKDRREVLLSLTPSGKKKYNTIKEHSRKKIASRLKNLSQVDQKKINDCLDILKELFNEF